MNLISTVEKAALLSNSTQGSSGGRLSNSIDDKDRLKCEHCGRSRHSKDQCWDLHEHPPNLNPCPFQQGGSRSSGRGGICFGGNQPSAHLVTPSSIELPSWIPTHVPHASCDNRGLSSNEIAALDVLFLNLITLPQHPHHPSLTQYICICIVYLSNHPSMLLDH